MKNIYSAQDRKLDGGKNEQFHMDTNRNMQHFTGLFHRIYGAQYCDFDQAKRSSAGKTKKWNE